LNCGSLGRRYVNALALSRVGWLLRRIPALLLAILVAACGGGGSGADTAPTPVPQNPPSATPPTITRLSPESPIGSPRQQQLEVLGTNFSPATVVTLSWKGTTDYKLPDGQITYDGSTRILIRITTSEDADTWSIKVTNPDSQSSTKSFAVRDPRQFPLDLVLPVEGAFRVTGSENTDCNNAADMWTLCQHGTGFHRSGGGISGSDETYAWDANLPTDQDQGKEVFPVAPGRVVKFAGTVEPGATSGSVLIEHTTGDFTWWSGYLHMSDVSVTDGQVVSTSTPIGRISNVCACGTVPNHLHLAVYYGDNSAGGLKSRNAPFRAREDLGLVGGRWMVATTDLAGTSWTGSVLHFTSAIPTTTGHDVNGYFVWSGTSGSYGRENFRGTLDGTGSLRVAGFQLVPPYQGIITVSYSGRLDSALRTITDGSWTGGIASNLWTASQSSRGVSVLTIAVPANTDAGTPWTVPASATVCSFQAGGVWYYGAASSTLAVAAGLDAPLAASGWRLPGARRYSLLASRSNDQFVEIGRSREIQVSGGETLRFLINDELSGYTDNRGAVVVSIACQ
jgi:Peptidase family M23